MEITFKPYTQDQRQIWEEINKSSISTFLASTDWIEFQKSIGREVDRYFIYVDSVAVGNLYIEIYRRKIAKFAYSPYGPVLLDENPNLQFPLPNIETVITSLKDFQKKYIKQKKLNLFRFDPLIDKENLKTFLQLGYSQSLAPTQAKFVWEIDLSQDEEQLRSGMSKSTRYNINKTSREGLEFIKVSTPEHVKAFSDLMNETTGRKKFSNYDYNYFQKQFDRLNPIGMCDIYLIKLQDKYLAGALINYYNDTAYYTHGCSTSDKELSKIRAPYFLQWNVMQESKARGFKKYNMWGIVPDELLNDMAPAGAIAMKGVSEFKKSFGGYEIDYVGGLEIGIDFIKYNFHRFVDWWMYRKDRY